MNNVSIIIPVFNAPEFVLKCISSIREKTEDIDYSIVIVDNCSDIYTKNILYNLLLSNQINILCCLEKNRFWSEANNIGASISDQKCNKFLLLNSDIEILDKFWLKKLIDIHQYGYTSYGAINANTKLGLPQRGDGYCGLIDRDLYEKYKLDTNFPWWFSITKLQSQLLYDGLSVQAIVNHNKIIKHYGGGSTTIKLPKQFTTLDTSICNQWFTTSNKIKIIYDI